MEREKEEEDDGPQAALYDELFDMEEKCLRLMSGYKDIVANRGRGATKIAERMLKLE